MLKRVKPIVYFPQHYRCKYFFSLIVNNFGFLNSDPLKKFKLAHHLGLQESAETYPNKTCLYGKHSKVQGVQTN